MPGDPRPLGAADLSAYDFTLPEGHIAQHIEPQHVDGVSEVKPAEGEDLFRDALLDAEIARDRFDRHAFHASSTDGVERGFRPIVGAEHHFLRFGHAALHHKTSV